MLGKILHEARAEERGRPRWDLVVVDAPASGHAVQLLRVPGAMLGTVPPGPLRSDAEWMRAWLVDPARTAVVLVTLPEEMPVIEAIELDRAAPRAGRPGAGRAPGERHAGGPLHRRRRRSGSAPLAEAPPPVGPAAQGGAAPGGPGRATRRATSPRCARRSRSPPALLPLLASPAWGRAEVERSPPPWRARPGEPAWTGPAARRAAPAAARRQGAP